MIHQKCASNCGHGDRFHLRMEPHMVVEDKVLSMVWLLNCREWQECRNLKAALRPFHCFIFIFQKSHTGHPCPISWHDHCTAALSADPASLFSVNPSQLLPHHFFFCPFFASGWLWKLPISIAEAFYITKWNFFSYLVHLSTLGDVQPLLQELLPRRTRRTTGTEQRSRAQSWQGMLHTHAANTPGNVNHPAYPAVNQPELNSHRCSLQREPGSSVLALIPGGTCLAQISAVLPKCSLSSPPACTAQHILTRQAMWNCHAVKPS